VLGNTTSASLVIETSRGDLVPNEKLTEALSALTDAIHERDFMRRQLRVVTHLDSSGSEEDADEDAQAPAGFSSPDALSPDADDVDPLRPRPAASFARTAPLAANRATSSFSATRSSALDPGGEPLRRRSTLRLLRQPTVNGGHTLSVPGPSHFRFRIGVTALYGSKWRHLKVMYGRERFYVHAPSLLVALLTLLFGWALLYHGLVDNSPVSPGGWIFDPFLLIFLSGSIGGVLSVLLHLPPLLCILWVAVGLSNATKFNITHAVRRPLKIGGLAMILLRGGISVNLNAIKPIRLTVALMSVVPLLAEVSVLTGVNFAVWNHLGSKEPWFTPTMGLLFASVVAPLSSSIIVTSALHLQSAGYGLLGGPPPVMVACVPFDSALGIWIANFMIESVLSTSNDVVDTPAGGAMGSGLIIVSNHTKSHNPILLAQPGWSLLQIPLGLVCGVVMGVLAELMVNLLYGDRGSGSQNAKTRADPQNDDDRDLRTSIHNRAFFLIFIGCFMGLAITEHYSIEGMGSLAVAAFGTMLGHRWRQRRDGDDRRKQFASRAAVVWNFCFMPALFAFVGSSATFTGKFIEDLGPTLLIIVCGCATRVTAAFLCSLTADFSWKERVVMAFGWVGKASAQATLGLAVRDRVEELCPESGKCSVWEARGERVSNMSVLMIMVAAPLSAITIRSLGRHWVRKEDLNANLVVGSPIPHQSPERH
jgi:hypothetical protein